jgi:hypothetical protein
MSERILSVTFEKKAMSHRDGQFSIPTRVCKLLGVDHGDEVHLIISHPNGGILFAGTRQTKSGYEIYGKDMAKIIKAGDRIRVTVSRP